MNVDYVYRSTMSTMSIRRYIPDNSFKPMLRNMPPLQSSRYGTAPDVPEASNSSDSDESDGYIPNNMFVEHVDTMSYLTMNNIRNMCSYMYNTVAACSKVCVKNIEECSEWAIDNRLIY